MRFVNCTADSQSHCKDNQWFRNGFTEEHNGMNLDRYIEKNWLRRILIFLNKLENLHSIKLQSFREGWTWEKERLRGVPSLGSFSKPQRRRRRERHQTQGTMSRTIAVHVRFESLYISLPSSAKQQREMTKFYVFWRTRTAMANFSYLFRNWTLGVPI